MRTVTLSEDDALDMLVMLFMLAATLENTRQLLVQADKHLPGELRYEARDIRAAIGFIAGLSVGEN